MNDPKTLVERLRHRAIPWEAASTNDGSGTQVWRGKGQDDPLLVEAADRIEALERLARARSEPPLDPDNQARLRVETFRALLTAGVPPDQAAPKAATAFDQLFR